MKGLLKYLKDYKLECVLAPLFKMLEASFELIIPLVVAKIINVGISRGDTPYIIKMCLVMILLGLVGFASAVTAQYFAAKAATGFAGKLRHDLFSHILSMSFSSQDKAGTSTLITRMTSDINQTQNGVNMFLRLFLRSPFIVLGAVIMGLYVGGKDAVIFVYALPVLSLVVFAIVFINIPMYKRVQKALDNVTLLVRENLTGVRVLRAFHKEDEEVKRFTQKNHEHASSALFAGRISALLNPLTYVIVNISLILLLDQGALAVYNGVLKQGDVVALVNYMSQILIELVKLANLIVTLTKAFACASRISEVLAIPVEGKDDTIIGSSAKDDRDDTDRHKDSGDNSDSDNDKADHIRFENVSFRYEGLSDDVLSDISFSVKRGEKIGIIGSTGSGKSSLISLVPGFYNAGKGRILIDGRDVREYEKEELRHKIGFVPQKTSLFKGTIKSNVLFGNEDASEQALKEALYVSVSDEIVSGREGNVEAEVEQGGRNFSGGQKQRLTIARALVRRPEILILDDSSSALDYATDAKLRKRISELDYDPTVLMVTQRTVGIADADKIIVLDDGNICGIGRHEQLLKTCSVYREIYESGNKEASDER
ncbi:MAG TPA: ATP-binding protein [Lachnospiraceae bacterium]|nr:ATP-binding protein [Lachnospiraceae bacterium]